MNLPTSQGTVDSQDTDERAREAVRAFRKMQPGLTSFARVLTRNNKVRVVLAQGGPRTDGTKIMYRPPIRLGDKVSHDRSKCDHRAPSGVQSCAACAVREEVLIQIYHEISHIAFGSFSEVEDSDRKALLRNALREYPSRFADQVKKRVADTPDSVTRSYMGLAGVISQFLPHLVNALEDCRIDNEMFRARKGTRRMFDVLTTQVFEEGVEGDNGERMSWKDQPLNAQAMVGVFCIGSDFDVTNWFADEVVEALADNELRLRVRAAVDSKSAAGVYRHAFPVLARLRELGFCKNEFDDEDDEDSADDQSDGQDSSDDHDDSDGDLGDDTPDDAEGDSDSDDDNSQSQGGAGQDDESEVDDDGSSDDDSAGDAGGDPSEDAGDGDGDPEPDASDEGGSSLDQDADDSSEDSGSGSHPQDGSAGGSGAGAEDSSDGEPEGEDGSSASSEGSDASADAPQQREDSHGEGEEGEASESEGDASSSEGGEQSGSDRTGEGPSESDGRSGGEADPSSGGAQDGSGGGEQSGGESDGLPDDSADSSDATAAPDGGNDDLQRGRDSGDSDPDAGDPGDAGTEGLSDEQESPSSGDHPQGQSEPGAREGDGDGRDDFSLGDETEHERREDERLDQSDESVDQESDEGSSVPEDSGSGDDSSSSSAPVDTGADKGEGGATSGSEGFGSPDDVAKAIDVFAHHGDIHDFDQNVGSEHNHTEGANEEAKAMDRAVIQGVYFETPSIGVGDIKVLRHDSIDQLPDNMDKEYFGWRYLEGGPFDLSDLDVDMAVRSGAHLGDAETPAESILGPATLQARRTFDDNLRADRQKNMRSGKVRSAALGKRAWANDDRLFGKKTVPGKKSYSVLIGIDISGSTVGQNILLAKRAAWAQAELCNRLGLDFAIYGHTTGPFHMDDGSLAMHMYEVKSFDEEWTPSTEQRLLQIAPVGGNLDGHSLEFYRKAVERRPSTDKIILYYSDGKMPASNYDEELEVLEREIKYCTRTGITLLGVGIRTDSPSKHGLDTVQVDADEDIKQVVSHLGKRLSSGR